MQIVIILVLVVSAIGLYKDDKRMRENMKNRYTFDLKEFEPKTDDAIREANENEMWG